MKVGVTAPGARDLDQHLAETRLGHGNVPELGGLLPCDKLVGLHLSPRRLRRRSSTLTWLRIISFTSPQPRPPERGPAPPGESRSPGGPQSPGRRQPGPSARSLPSAPRARRIPECRVTPAQGHTRPPRQRRAIRPARFAGRQSAPAPALETDRRRPAPSSPPF